MSSTSARDRSAKSSPPPRRAPSPSAKFSRDGTGVYFVSNRDGDYARLRFVNLFTADKTDLSGRGDTDVEQLALSKDGHYLAYVTDEGGADKLNLVDLRAHQDLVAPTLPARGVVDSLSFDPDSRRLLFGSDRGQPSARRLRARPREQSARGLDRERAGSARPHQVRRAAPHSVPDLRSGGR